jgi:hypothetical protein
MGPTQPPIQWVLGALSLGVKRSQGTMLTTHPLLVLRLRKIEPIMKILLGDFNAKVGRENIFKPTIGNESLHEISNNNGVTVVNFTASKT